MSLTETIDQGMHFVALAIGVVGVAVIVWGIARSLWVFARIELLTLVRGDAPGREALRSSLSHYLLLGLELLVAADIVESIITPDLEHLASLGAIVLIRTVISFSLNWELKQHRDVDAS